MSLSGRLHVEMIQREEREEGGERSRRIYKYIGERRKKKEEKWDDIGSHCVDVYGAVDLFHQRSVARMQAELRLSSTGRTY